MPGRPESASLKFSQVLACVAPLVGGPNLWAFINQSNDTTGSRQRYFSQQLSKFALSVRRRMSEPKPEGPHACYLRVERADPPPARGGKTCWKRRGMARAEKKANAPAGQAQGRQASGINVLRLPGWRAPSRGSAGPAAPRCCPPWPAGSSRRAGSPRSGRAPRRGRSPRGIPWSRRTGRR